MYQTVKIPDFTLVPFTIDKTIHLALWNVPVIGLSRRGGRCMNLERRACVTGSVDQGKVSLHGV